VVAAALMVAAALASLAIRHRPSEVTSP